MTERDEQLMKASIAAYRQEAESAKVLATKKMAEAWAARARAAVVSADIANLRAERTEARLRRQGLSLQLGMPILEMVCAEFNVDVVSMQARSNVHEFVIARQVAALLLLEVCGWTTTNTAEMLGYCDHTTVLYGRRKIRERCAANPELDARVRRLFVEASRLMMQPPMPTLVGERDVGEGVAA